MKKSTRQKKYDAIHKTIRDICLIRHPYCVVCGKRDGILQGGHLIPKKRSLAVRFDLMNVHTLCSGCNFQDTISNHLHTAWFIKEYGEEEYLSLVEKSRLVVQYKMWELDEIHETLKQILKDMK